MLLQISAHSRFHIFDVNNSDYEMFTINSFLKSQFKTIYKKFLKKNFKNLKTTVLFNLTVLASPTLITNSNCLRISIYLALYPARYIFR